MPIERTSHRIAWVLLLLSATACDRSPLLERSTMEPPVDLPADVVQLRCVADVAAGEIACAVPEKPLPQGPNADRIIGGQDRNVKLSSAGTAYDGGTQIFRSTVTVQNLSAHFMGTPDGVTVEGVRIFMHEGPTVTSGTGEVSIGNADGTDVFTASDQPYFEYAQILAPMEISAGREWQFSVSPTVNTFSFFVFVSAPMVDESARLLGPVWTGADSTSAWAAAGNWDLETVPDSASSATIPNDTLIAGAPHPLLASDATVQHLRVGAGSTLDLGGNQLEVRGNVDATGAIVNGALLLTSDSALAGGTLPAVELRGNARTQRPTVAMGAVRITGSLSIAGAPLSIAVP